MIGGGANVEDVPGRSDVDGVCETYELWDELLCVMLGALVTVTAMPHFSESSISSTDRMPLFSFRFLRFGRSQMMAAMIKRLRTPIIPPTAIMASAIREMPPMESVVFMMGSGRFE